MWGKLPVQIKARLPRRTSRGLEIINKLQSQRYVVVFIIWPPHESPVLKAGCMYAKQQLELLGGFCDGKHFFSKHGLNSFLKAKRCCFYTKVPPGTSSALCCPSAVHGARLLLLDTASAYHENAPGDSWESERRCPDEGDSALCPVYTSAGARVVSVHRKGIVPIQADDILHEWNFTPVVQSPPISPELILRN